MYNASSNDVIFRSVAGFEKVLLDSSGQWLVASAQGESLYSYVFRFQRNRVFVSRVSNRKRNESDFAYLRLFATKNSVSRLPIGVGAVAAAQTRRLPEFKGLLHRQLFVELDT